MTSTPDPAPAGIAGRVVQAAVVAVVLGCIALVLLLARSSHRPAPDAQLTLMPLRHDTMVAIDAAYPRTGAPLVERAGGGYRGVGHSDDGGLYIIVPWVARLTGSAIPAAFTLTALGALALALLAGGWGVWLLLPSTAGRAAGLAALAVAGVLAAGVGDIYLVSALAPIGLGPLTLFLCRRGRLDRWFFGWVVVCGLAAGLLHTLRIHSGTSLVIFLLPGLWAGCRATMGRKAAVLGLLIAAALVPLGWKKLAEHRRDAWLAEHQPDAVKPPEVRVFWHSIFIAFGFLGNDYGIRYQDEVGIERAKAIDPKAVYPTRRYEQVMRGEVVRLFKQHPFFVILTVAAKLGVIALFLLMTLHAGLLAAWRYPGERWADLAFLGAGAFASIYGVLVIPRQDYLLGLMCWALLYGGLSCGRALTEGGWSALGRWGDRAWTCAREALRPAPPQPPAS